MNKITTSENKLVLLRFLNKYFLLKLSIDSATSFICLNYFISPNCVCWNYIFWGFALYFMLFKIETLAFLLYQTVYYCIDILINSKYKSTSGIFRMFGVYNCIGYSLKINYTVVINNSYVNQKLFTTGSMYSIYFSKTQNTTCYLIPWVNVANKTTWHTVCLQSTIHRSPWQRWQNVLVAFPLVRYHKLACCNSIAIDSFDVLNFSDKNNDFPSKQKTKLF